MKIREIRSTGLRGKTPEGGWSNELRPEDCVHTLVAVHTNEGLVGLGSVFTNDGLVREAIEVMRPLWEGELAVEPERVAEKLHQNTFWMGRGGSITHAISGIDIALWDLLGQVSGQPVSRLLGGRHREKVLPYASLLMTEPDQMKDELLRVKESGFRAFKIGWGPFGRRNEKTDRAIVEAAREALGPSCRLMVDAGASDAFWEQGCKWALNTARMLAEYDIFWFEEALGPDHLHDYVKLREHSPVKIAGGEVLTRRQAYLPWLEAGAFDIVQPDVTKVGGISEERRIAWMAQDHNINCIPHGWNTAIGLAADLQLSSAVHGMDMVEYISGSPFVDEITLNNWQLDEEGMLEIPDTPGLGVALDHDRIRPYLTDKTFLDPSRVITQPFR